MNPLRPLLVFAFVATAAAQTPAPSPTASPSPSPTPPAALTPREIINVLSDSQLNQAISSLQSGFLDGSRTNERELRRATLEGLLDRLAPGVLITTEFAVRQAAAAPPFLAEILDARIGYLRPGQLDKSTLAQLDAALENFKSKALKAVILDLRGEPPTRDYDLAAEFARRFSPRGRILFSIEKPSAKQERILTASGDPLFTGIVVVLTDRETAGAAEALAATLRLNANAMIVGTTTRGEAVEFSDVSLGDGKILRVAVAQVALPGLGPIFPGGVKPDIAAALPSEVQAKIFARTKQSGVSQFVFETERPHLNEAALVANTNPEIDPANAKPANREELWDTVLQRAVDLVTAISFYHDRPAGR